MEPVIFGYDTEVRVSIGQIEVKSASTRRSLSGDPWLSVEHGRNLRVNALGLGHE